MPPQSTPAPAAPAPTAKTQTTVVSGTPAPAAVAGTPEQIYRGLREKREVLGDQKQHLMNEREEIVRQIRDGAVSDADRAGLEQRLAGVDQQIAKVSIDIAEADAQVAQAASVPGAVVDRPERDPWQNGPPVELVAMTLGLTAVLLFPVCLAWARRLWRRASVISAVPPELVERIAAMERGIDAIAVEVERVGEGQRFVTQLLAERAEAARLASPEPVRRTEG